MSQLPGSGVFDDFPQPRGSVVFRRLKAGVLFVIIAGSGIGLTALVTGLAEPPTTSLINATSSPKTTPVQQSVRTTALKAQTKLTPIPTKPKQAAVAVHPEPICRQQDRTNAAKAYGNRLKSEARRHSAAQRSIERSGWMSRILNPGVYRYRLDQESNSHQQALHAIVAQYQTDLRNAHCTS
jgi:hypothetical protein